MKRGMRTSFEGVGCLMVAFCMMTSVFLVRMAASAPMEGPMRLGVELPRHQSSMNALYPFVDLMKATSSFNARVALHNGGWGYWNNADINWRSDGYPAALGKDAYDRKIIVETTFGRVTSEMRSNMVVPPRPPYVSGDVYDVTFSGVGFVAVEGDGVGNGSDSFSFTIGASADSSETFEGLLLRILETDVSDPVRDIRIMPRWAEQETLFRPELLEVLGDMEVLRFGEWAGEYVRVHGRPILKAEDFSVDRALPSDATQGSAKGVALEYALELCKAVNATCWLTVPQDASEAYLRDMARFVSSGLLESADGSPVRVYVEYGRDQGYSAEWQKEGLPAMLDAWENALQERESELSMTSGALRSRLRFVLAVTNPFYWPHIVALHGKAVLERVDTIAFAAQQGRSLPWNDNFFPAGTAQNWTESYVHDEIRRNVLDEEVVYHRRVHAVHEANLTRVGPPFPVRAPGIVPPQKTHEIIAYAGGVDVNGPVYGYRGALRGGESETPELRRLADAEQYMEDLLLRSQLNSSALESDETNRSRGVSATEAIVLDAMHRFERSGFGAFVGGPLMMPWVREQKYGAWYQGAKGLTQSWSAPSAAAVESLGETEASSSRWAELPESLTRQSASTAPDAKAWREYVLSHSPQLRAWNRFRHHKSEPTPLALTAADRSTPLSDGGVSHTCDTPCQWGTCFKGECRCFHGVEGDACDTIVRPACAHPKLGINVGGIADWSTELKYVDHFRSSRDWISQCGTGSCSSWENYQHMDLSPENNVLSLAPAQATGSMMLRDLGGHYYGGEYVVLYEGDGIITLSMDDVRNVRRSPGRIELELVPTTGLNNGLFLRIERTNPADPIRNIRVVERAFEDKYAAFPFHPRFLDILSDFSTIRAMDLLNTNGNHIVEWSERVTRANRTYSINGVPVEDVVLLCNTVGANLWINVPYRASDDFVRNLALTIKSNLRPDLNVSVELANEVWGTLFPGGQYAREQGLLLNMDDLSTLATGADEAAFCWYGSRSREIFAIFESVFGSTARQERLTFVLASQSANPDVSRRILACNDSGLYADALSLAPYFGGALSSDPDDDRTALDVGVVVNTSLPLGVETQINRSREHLEYARAYGLRVTAYEAGQGLVATGSDRLTKVAIAANRHPDMRKLYRRYISGLWSHAEMDELMLFSSVGQFSQYGSWGLWEALDAPLAVSPKAHGVLDMVDGGRICPDSSASFTECPSLPPPHAVPTVVVRSQDGSVSRTVKEALQEVEDLVAGKSGSGGDVNVGGDGSADSNSTLCSSSGVCAPLALGGDGESCFCDHGSAGEACNEREIVQFSTCSYQCSGHGTCELARIERGYEHYYECFCDEGYAGDHCTVFQCTDHCSYNGRCNGDLECDCYDGFRGPTCAIDCKCGGRGRCSAPGSTGPPCRCDPGYAWNGTTCAPQCACASPAQKCIRPGVCSLLPGHCVKGDEVNGRCECWAGWQGPRCDVRHRPGTSGNRVDQLSSLSPVGMNLGGVADWSTEYVFADLFKTSRAWISQWAPGWRPSGEYIWDLKTPQNLSREGWPRDLYPRQALATLMARDVFQKLPSGVYTVTYDGDGDLEFGMDASVIKERKGWIQINVRLSTVRDNGIYLRVTATNASNPIRNIRVAMPGMAARVEDGAIFHPLYIAAARRYSALRMMDLQHTNHAHRQRQWSDRPTLSTASYGAGWDASSGVVGGDAGVALEHLIHLANVAQADPWFCIPHAADDTYIRNMARMIRDNLDPSLQVFIARSNERWNPLFRAYQYDVEQAYARGLANNHVYHGARSMEIFEIFEREFGPKARRERLIFVVDTHTVNSWVTEQIFSANASLFDAVDAVGVTAYIDCGGLGGRDKAYATSLMTVDQILDECDSARDSIDGFWRQQISLLRQIVPRNKWKVGVISNDSAAALQRSLFSTSPIPLVTYEAGPALVESAAIERGSETPGLTDKFIAATRSDRMEDVYYAYLRSFESLGLAGGRRSTMPYFHFSSVGRPSKYGSWGLLEHSAQPRSSSPKARALDRFVAEVVSDLTRPGCMNPAAVNYDPQAVTSNSSCVFPPRRISAATGGVVSVADAASSSGRPSVVLRFPANALSDDRDISVEEVLIPPPVNSTSTARREIAGPVFRFGPPGTVFNTPVNVCISINMSIVNEFGWSAWTGTSSTASSEVDADTLLNGWNDTDASSSLTDQLSNAAEEDVADAVIGLYHSSDGLTWLPSEQTWWDPNTGELCGLLRHFTVVGGIRVPEQVFVAEQAVVRSELDEDTTNDDDDDSTSSSTKKESDASQLSMPLIIGICVGAALALVVGVGLFFIWRSVQKKRTHRIARVANNNPTKVIESKH